jgi:hypothetical protein
VGTADLLALRQALRGPLARYALMTAPCEVSPKLIDQNFAFKHSSDAQMVRFEWEWPDGSTCTSDMLIPATDELDGTNRLLDRAAWNKHLGMLRDWYARHLRLRMDRVAHRHPLP